MKRWKLFATLVVCASLSACAHSPRQNGSSKPLSLQSPFAQATSKARPLLNVQTLKNETELIAEIGREQNELLSIAMEASYWVRNSALSPFVNKLLKEEAKSLAELRAYALTHHPSLAGQLAFTPTPQTFSGAQKQRVEQALEAILVQHEKLLLLLEQRQTLSVSAELSNTLQALNQRYLEQSPQLLNWSERGVPPAVKAEAKKRSTKKSANSSNKSSKSSKKSKKTQSKKKKN